MINQVGNKKGTLLVQLPPSVKSGHMPQLIQLLSTIRRADPDLQWDTAVEFRDKSWYQENTYRLLDDLQMGMVLHDLSASATPMMETEVNFIYLRFHGLMAVIAAATQMIF